MTWTRSHLCTLKSVKAVVWRQNRVRPQWEEEVKCSWHFFSDLAKVADAAQRETAVGRLSTFMERSRIYLFIFVYLVRLRAGKLNDNLARTRLCCSPTLASVRERASSIVSWVGCSWRCFNTFRELFQKTDSVWLSRVLVTIVLTLDKRQLMENAVR